MIYAYDQNIQYPVKDLYDNQVVAMSIAAAKDMYEKGQQELKDFKAEFGDFYSPIQSDMDWYNKNVTGRVRDAINYMYSNGIDPIRSSEGRAMISQIINSMPTGDIAQKRLRAKNAEEYYKNMGAMRKAGLYDDAFSKSLGEDPTQWADDFTGYTSPTIFKTLKEATNEWYNNTTPGTLTKEDVESFGLKYDPRYTWTGFSDRNLMDVARNNTPGWQGSVYADYYRNIAKQQVIAKGQEPTAENVEKQLQRNIADSQYEWLKAPQKKADEFAVLAQKHADEVAVENLSHRHAMARQAAASRVSESKGSSTKEATSYGQALMQRGIANWAGSSDPGVKGLERAKNFAASTRNVPANMRSGAFLNFYSMPDAESTSSWVNRFHGDSSRTKDAATGGVNYVASVDNKKLFTANEIASNTLDYPGYPLGHSKKHIASDASMVPTGRVYTAPMNDGTYSQFVEVKVGNDDSSQTLFYKVAETEPQPIISNVDALSNPVWGTPRNDQPFAPNGYSITPSQRTRNQWSIQDAGLNQAARLAAEQTRAGQGIFLDDTP